MAPYCLPGAELSYHLQFYYLPKLQAPRRFTLISHMHRLDKLRNGKGLTGGNLVPLQGLGIQSL